MTPQRQAFTLFAGIDVSDGQLSRLHHGEIDATHSFGDPLEAARHFVDAGATWLNVADLDAAQGTGSNLALIERIVRQCGTRAHVQVSCGVTDAASAKTALALGAARVVLDTAALADPDWVSSLVAAHHNRIVVAITSDHDQVYSPGSDLHGTSLDALLDIARGTHAQAFMVSDVDSRGIRKVSERNALDRVIRAMHGHVISDGGVFRLGDLHALTELVPHGLNGAVIDAALYTGGFTYAEAVAALQERYDLFFWGPPIG